MISPPRTEPEQVEVPAERAPSCILCGRCLEVCPLFQATQREELSPKAKQLLAQTTARATKATDGQVSACAVTPALVETKAAVDLASLCLGCGRCAAVCPQGLSIPDAVAGLRAAHPGFRAWIWKTWLIRAAVLWPALSSLATRLPERKAGLRLRTLQAMRCGPLPPAWLRPLFGTAPPAATLPAQAVIFGGCLANFIRQDWLGKAHAVAEGLGCALLPAPEWSCCGASLGGAGLPGAQHALRVRNVRAWRQAGRPVLLVFCASCLDGLRACAMDSSLNWAPGEAAIWTASLVPLAMLWGETQFEVSANAPQRLHYHQPCHGGAGAVELEWLRRVVGGRLGNWTAVECCGLGGVLQLAAPELGRTVARTCWERLAARPGEHVLTGCSGCVLQLSATAPAGVQVGHWLDALDVVAPPSSRL